MHVSLHCTSPHIVNESSLFERSIKMEEFFPIVLVGVLLILLIEFFFWTEQNEEICSVLVG